MDIVIDNGFCNSETEITSNPNRGEFKWEETTIGNTSTVSCPFGPIGATGTRTCLSRNQWSSSLIDSCATAITVEFTILNNTVLEVSSN